MEIPVVYNTLETYLLIAALLLGFGIYGILKNRSLIGILISAELVLCAASVNFMAFNRFLVPDPVVGQIFALFIMGLAAAEAAIILSIIVAVYRNYKSIDPEETAELAG
ncbi:NADH-quinone oxidoreductase subunit NuoK [Desulfurivibrio dismutans]|uniref:NADH-quinone oxidoreductase subunit NuoK n=1 Tax=Desulfurivibrio dismutans TaxID=1398908 RepID=UPI0023DB6B57|nr:NADH-quinone oxidoreductase subunit NuoK [Desulfurivibrio alkaliphilus]MDF1614022.1 NADH-quinone oxidoreductase subunit NuoK [Desulfurivibrio alkaliphilus]